MKIAILSSSPNRDGLTAACTEAAIYGASLSMAETDDIRLNEYSVAKCDACNNGWGTCLNEHICQVQDDFQALHARVLAAQGYILVTPVYWGEMSESAKAFTDRLRRCEATRGQGSGFAGKPVIAVAAAGGSGNGMITCLASMERWIEHVQARKFDFIAVNRWNREYKIDTIQAAARLMVKTMMGIEQE